MLVKGGTADKNCGGLMKTLKCGGQLFGKKIPIASISMQSVMLKN